MVAVCHKPLATVTNLTNCVSRHVFFANFDWPSMGLWCDVGQFQLATHHNHNRILKIITVTKLSLWNQFTHSYTDVRQHKEISDRHICVGSTWVLLLHIAQYVIQIFQIFTWRLLDVKLLCINQRENRASSHKGQSQMFSIRLFPYFRLVMPVVQCTTEGHNEN
jgi:hypothetical protein